MMGIDWKRAVRVDLDFSGHVETRVRVGRRDGWRQRLAMALRDLAARIDGRKALVVEFESIETTRGQRIELQPNEVKAAVKAGLAHMGMTANNLAVERSIDDDLRRLRPELWLRGED
jgi:hypothetical protein